MARPKKCRKVCALPETQRFEPLDSHTQEKTISLTVDEYETIRLIDLEGLTQEQCAQKMQVARTTVQSIYAGARTKLATALVHGKTLTIQGGSYILCSRKTTGCSGSCPRQSL